MTIKFHCEHCGKSISAPDSAGGKRGKCPACQEVLYVPAQEEQEDLLDLAPLDDAEERRRQKLVEKSLAAEHDLLIAQGRVEAADKDADDDLLETGRHAEGGVLLPELGGGDLRTQIVNYLSSMAAGELVEANAIVASLRADPRAVRTEIQLMLNDPIRDPRLAKLPPPVIAGFIKQLQQAMK